MATPEPKKKKAKKAKKDDTKDDAVATPFIVKVGKAVYETTKDELLGKEDASWFHAQLSGRWKSSNTSDKNDGIDLVISRDGKMFYYILYYLRFGAIPYQCGDQNEDSVCLLGTEELRNLQNEADFFLLPGLVELCESALDIFGKFGSIGDFDGSPYTDFKYKLRKNFTRYHTEISYEMEYKYKGKEVSVSFSADVGDGGDKLDISARCGNKKIISNEIFKDKFPRFQAAIVAGNGSVSKVLAQVKIAPEAQLWFAVVIAHMLEYYDSYQDFNFEFGDHPLWFLYSDTTWSFN